MSLNRRQFTKGFKKQVLREIAVVKSVAYASREHQRHPNCIGDWKRQAVRYGIQVFASNGDAYKEEAKIAELERLIGQQAVEIAFLKRALTHLEAQQSTPVSGSSK